MIRYKKIRGHNRILKDIDTWVAHNKTLDLDYLENKQREYVKFWVAPFGGISLLNSEFSPPKGKARKKIVNGIFEIYQNWKKQLETLNKPYYLKIWYFPHDVSKCHVVCTIEDFINFYDITFHKPKDSKPFPDKNDLEINWEYRHQEHHLTMDDIGEVEDFMTEKDFLDNKKWVESVMRNPKTRISEYPDDENTPTYYSIKDCDVWIGG